MEKEEPQTCTSGFSEEVSVLSQDIDTQMEMPVPNGHSKKHILYLLCGTEKGSCQEAPSNQRHMRELTWVVGAHAYMDCFDGYRVIYKLGDASPDMIANILYIDFNNKPLGNSD